VMRSVKRLQLGGESRVNEVQINPLLNSEQLLWNSNSVFRPIIIGHMQARRSRIDVQSIASV
jgi:hypothetical protein